MKVCRWIRRTVKRAFLVGCTLVLLSPVNAEARSHEHAHKSHEVNQKSEIDVANAALKGSGIRLSTSLKSWKTLWKFRQELAKASGMDEVWRGTRSQNVQLLGLWKQHGFPHYDSESGTFTTTQQSAELPVQEKDKSVQIHQEVTDPIQQAPTEPAKDMVDTQVDSNATIQVQLSAIPSTMDKAEDSKEDQKVITLHTPEPVIASPTPTMEVAPTPAHAEIKEVLKHSTSQAHAAVSRKWLLLPVGVLVIILLGCLCFGRSSVKPVAQDEPLRDKPLKEQEVPVAKPVSRPTIPPLPPLPKAQFPLQAQSRPAPLMPVSRSMPSVILPTASSDEGSSSWITARAKKIRTGIIMTDLSAEDVTIDQFADSCTDFPELDLALGKCNSVQTDQGKEDKEKYLGFSKSAQIELKKLRRDFDAGYSYKPEYFENFRQIISQTPSEFQVILWSCTEKMLATTLPEEFRR